MKRRVTTRGEFFYNAADNDRGFALVTTILLLIVLAVLLGVSTHWTAMDIKRTANYGKTREAFFIADAGIQDAINHMNYTASGDSPGAAANHFAAALTSWPSEFTSGVDYQGGTYKVSIADNNDDADQTTDKDLTVVVKSTASKRGKTSVIEAVLHLPRAMGDAAIIVQDELNVSGTVSVTLSPEDLKGVHSNADTTIGGTVDFNGSGATGVDDCQMNGNPDATCDSGDQYERDIPRLFPKDYKEFCHYVMKNDGAILYRGADLTDNIVYTWDNGDKQWESGGVAETTLKGFKHDAQGWSVNGDIKPSGADQNVPNNAMLYFEDAFKAAGKVGILGNEWLTTIIAEKDIAITGKAFINNCAAACNGDEAIANLFLIAGDDLKTPKLDSPIIHGVFAALDQISLGGGATLKGTVISNSYDGTYKGDTYLPYDSNVVNNDVNAISGNLTIVYEGPVVLPVTENKVRVLTWKEYTARDL